MNFCHYHCLDGFNEETVLLSVHRAFVIENNLSIAALVLGFWHFYGFSFPNCAYIKTFTSLQ
jgi:hypothetical protein